MSRIKKVGRISWKRAISKPAKTHATQLNITNLAESFITKMSEALYGMCKTVGSRRKGRRRMNGHWIVMDTQLLYVPAAKNNCIYHASIATGTLLPQRITVNVFKPVSPWVGRLLQNYLIILTLRISVVNNERVNTN